MYRENVVVVNKITILFHNINNFDKFKHHCKHVNQSLSPTIPSIKRYIYLPKISLLKRYSKSPSHRLELVGDKTKLKNKQLTL